MHTGSYWISHLICSSMTVSLQPANSTYSFSRWDSSHSKRSRHNLFICFSCHWADGSQLQRGYKTNSNWSAVSFFVVVFDTHSIWKQKSNSSNSQFLLVFYFWLLPLLISTTDMASCNQHLLHQANRRKELIPWNCNSQGTQNKVPIGPKAGKKCVWMERYGGTCII